MNESNRESENPIYSESDDESALSDDAWAWPAYPKNAARNYDRNYGTQFTGWEGDFLEALRNSGIMRLACAAARVSIPLVQRRRERDSAFNKAYKQAREEAVDLMEAAAFKRAIQGSTRKKPYFSRGKLLHEEVITEYSDSLLMFLLKANRPEKYREQIDHTHNIQIVEEEARRLARENGLDEERVLSEARRILGL